MAAIHSSLNLRILAHFYRACFAICLALAAREGHDLRRRQPTTPGVTQDCLNAVVAFIAWAAIEHIRIIPAPPGAPQMALAATFLADTCDWHRQSSIVVEIGEVVEVWLSIDSGQHQSVQFKP